MKQDRVIRIAALVLLLGGIICPAIAEEVQPRDEATTYYNNAEILIQKGDFENAVAFFDKALASNTTMIRLSDALLYTYRDKAYAQIQWGHYADAVITADSGLSEFVKDKMLWNNKGYALFNLGKYSEALDAYNKALESDRDYTIALINKGDTLSRMGRYNEAVDSYTRVLEADPGNHDATVGLTRAQQHATPYGPGLIVALVIVLVIVVAAAYWYTRIRKPSGNTPADDRKNKSLKK